MLTVACIAVVATVLCVGWWLICYVDEIFGPPDEE